MRLLFWRQLSDRSARERDSADLRHPATVQRHSHHGPCDRHAVHRDRADTVSVKATFSPAVDDGTDTYFFAMEFDPKIDLSHYSIEYSESMLPNAAYYVTSFICNGGAISCGSETYTESFALVPEPSTWAMMALGFGGLGYAGYRKSRKAISVAA